MVLLSCSAWGNTAKTLGNYHILNLQRYHKGIHFLQLKFQLRYTKINIARKYKEM